MPHLISRLPLRRYARGWRLAVVALTLACALGVLAWLDYSASRAEFLALARRQAASLRDTIGTAAVVAHAAAEDAEAQKTQHLLDTARVLAELDARQLLTQSLLDSLVTRGGLFRITVLDADGTRALQTFAAAYDASHHPRGPAAGGDGRAGSPYGLGPSGTALADRLLRGTEREVVSTLHVPQSAVGARLSAGVRRAGGGGILVSVEASDVASIQQQSTVETLLDDIVRTTGDVAYVALDRPGSRAVVGTAPPDVQGPATREAAPVLTERELRLPAGRVLEVTGPVTLADGAVGYLRIGMRLDALERAERRTLARLAALLASALTLGGLALGLVWLRREYGVLSERHARAEDALRRRDRLAAMGELASTVAHEIRNPLNAIAMSTQRLAHELPSEALEDAETRSLLEIAQREARRIEGTVQRFLEFARPPRLAPRLVEIGPWLAAAIDALHPLAAARGVQLTLDATSARAAEIDPDQLRQALDNVVRNAIEATPEGGSVRVTAAAAGEGLEIAVRDTGAGIPDDVRPRVFSLYFTTKAGGTGVGLAVAQQAVTAHGGTIEVETEQGRGTCMRLRIPLRLDGRHA